MKKAGVLFVVIAFAMLSRMASADSVLYATWGMFANPGSGFTISNAGAPDGTSTIHDGTSTGSTITFTGVTNLVDTPSDIPLGIFTTSTPLTKGEIDTYNGTTFTLTIDQLSPATGIGSIVANLSGTLRKSTHGAGASTLDLTWGGQSLTLEGVTYQPDDMTIAGATFTTPTTLQGQITAVPAPKAVLGGFGLLALLPITVLIRRRSACASIA